MKVLPLNPCIGDPWIAAVFYGGGGSECSTSWMIVVPEVDYCHRISCRQYLLQATSGKPLGMFPTLEAAQAAIPIALKWIEGCALDTWSGIDANDFECAVIIGYKA